MYVRLDKILLLHIHLALDPQNYNMKRNLSGQKKIKQPLGTKKLYQLSGQKNHATSQDKNKSCNFWGQKTTTQLLGTKKITQPLGTTKIMLGIRTKKSPNFLGQINQATSWDK